MVDNENIKAGDRLMCISNEGLWSVGNMRLIYGLTEKSINMSGSTTGWQSRETFRWSNYIHYPCEEIPIEVLDFADKTRLVMENNNKLFNKHKKVKQSL